jgi:hypothetical protein
MFTIQIKLRLLGEILLKDACTFVSVKCMVQIRHNYVIIATMAAELMDITTTIPNKTKIKFDSNTVEHKSF